ncbi:hypothetical protein E2P84_37695 [Burkholderia cepacia]|uniref:Uncharacterized protein n=1 Tax=Burkholderia cepacia TaxID=292 RepID=A0AAX2R9M8_BURCE|nr:MULTISPECIES: hypothetical protein [Burkholderia cepacia complex]MCA7889964.1 hypothetical protein [Burkholderia contaminans]MDN7577289.1 hypothetical protein [Burkholderia contaminans]TES64772.1 hypothetical protein E2P84_37695 [Burkholderia cepacia]TES95604.1 hypothetical protein E3D36_38105 [Burkholderia cepacia]TEU31530.1 hypothetical protein E3D37_44810 [Burkholderia cepacia]
MNTTAIEFAAAATANVEASVTVSVIAWKSANGWSFEWFYSAFKAEGLFEQAKADCEDRHECSAHVVLCDVKVSSYDAASTEIEAQLEEILSRSSMYPAPDARLKSDRTLH